MVGAPYFSRFLLIPPVGLKAIESQKGSLVEGFMYTFSLETRALFSFAKFKGNYNV